MRFSRYFRGLLSFALLATVLALAAGAAPATAPAIDPATPRGALIVYSDALPAGGIKAAIEAYQAGNDRELTFARALARVDLASAVLEQLASQKFGQKAANDIVHAMRARTDEDVVDAIEKINGNRATIDWADGRDPLTMIKVNGKWKVSMADVIGPDDKVEDYVKTNDELTAAIEEITRKAQAGEYSNAYLLERAIKQRMYRILGQDAADD